MYPQASPSDTSTAQAPLQRDTALEKVPARALPTLCGMLKHARHLARFVDGQFLLLLLIRKYLPAGMPGWSAAAMAAGLVHAAKWIWYGTAGRRGARRRRKARRLLRVRRRGYQLAACGLAGADSTPIARPSWGA